MLRALATVFALLATQAGAVSRYDATSMTCDEVRNRLQAEGAAILRHRSPTGMPLFDRYVSDRRFCDAEQIAERWSVPTADRPSCPVHRCADFEFPVPDLR